MHHLAIALVSVVVAFLGLHRPAGLSQYVPGTIWLVASRLEDTSTSTIGGPALDTDALEGDSLDEDTFVSSLAVSISEALTRIPTFDEPISTLDQPLEPNTSIYNPWDHTGTCQLPSSDTRPLIPLEVIILILLLAAGTIHVYTRPPSDARHGRREGYMQRADTEILKFITDMRSLKQSLKDGLDVLMLLADGQTHDLLRHFDRGGWARPPSCPRSSEPGQQLNLLDELLLDLGEEPGSLESDEGYDSDTSEIEETAMVAPLSITLVPHNETRVLEMVSELEDMVAELEDPARRPPHLGPPFL